VATPGGYDSWPQGGKGGGGSGDPTVFEKGGGGGVMEGRAQGKDYVPSRGEKKNCGRRMQRELEIDRSRVIGFSMLIEPIPLGREEIAKKKNSRVGGKLRIGGPGEDLNQFFKMRTLEGF